MRHNPRLTLEMSMSISHFQPGYLTLKNEDS